MEKILPVLALLVLCAATKFNLPVEIICNGAPVQGKGGVVCAQKEAPSSLRVKIPPTKGQLRVTDCNQDLTADGNPDDFNTKIERDGWWIFSRTVRVLSTTPVISIPKRPYDDCGISVSVIGENTGTQTADIIFESRMQGAFTLMKCGSETLRVDKVAICRALEGALLEFAPIEESGTLIVIGTACGIAKRVDLVTGQLITLQVPKGRCVLDLAHVNLGKTVRSRVLVLGQDREARELDSPLMVREGSSRRIYKPIGANLTATEIYKGDAVLWRSGVRDQDSYTIDSRYDGGPWPSGAIACHTAYSEALQSISGSCYNLDSDKEVPYFFK